MKREHVGWLIIAVLVGVLVTWVARNTYWSSQTIPLPPQGEAATNPFYIREKFAQALGARTQWVQSFRLPPGNGIAYVAMLNWDLITVRREQLQHWVEAGGRLVVDDTLIGSTGSFEKWSGIGRETPEQTDKVVPKGGCSQLKEQGTHTSYAACNMDSLEVLATRHTLQWAVRDKYDNLLGARVRIGRGSVTVLTGDPFARRSLFLDDNGELFVAATQLRRGDAIYFYSESDQDTLLMLACKLGWPVLCVLAVVLVLGIWRGSVRFGPLAPPTETARRSLAEQIRGTGQFTMRIGSADALHAATARALKEAAVRYINAYEALPGAEQMQALANATGFEASSLAAAFHYRGSGRTEHLRADLELLEAARRRILLKHMRPRHGN